MYATPLLPYTISWSGKGRNFGKNYMSQYFQISLEEHNFLVQHSLLNCIWQWIKFWQQMGWKALQKVWTKKHFTIPYHSQAKGHVKAVKKTIKYTLKWKLDVSKKAWVDNSLKIVGYLNHKQNCYRRNHFSYGLWSQSYESGWGEITFTSLHALQQDLQWWIEKQRDWFPWGKDRWFSNEAFHILGKNDLQLQ